MMGFVTAPLNWKTLNDNPYLVVGNIFISVGSGNGHIDSVQVNGGALTNTQNQFFMQGNQLVVVSAQLSKPTNTDSYVIFVTDGTGSRLVVTFDAVNG